MNSNYTICKHLIALCLGCTLLAACGQKAATPTPPPIGLTGADTGYFCGMIVAEHSGPKSQIILEGASEALWFTTTRDGIAFQRLPEETRPISAFYVTAVDRGGWENPEANLDNMIHANRAWFVINSSKRGSMGAPETIPFADRAAADDFAAEFGGTVLALADIADGYVLGPGDRQ